MKRLVDGEAALRQRLLAKLPHWYRYPADYRTVKYKDATKDHIAKLWNGVSDDEELETTFLYALYAGLRQHELFSAAVIYGDQSSYIEVPNARASADFRRIPLHPRLATRRLDFRSSKEALSARFSKRKDKSLNAVTHITSLNYALYAELIRKGIDLLDLVALTHGKDEAFWDEKTMKRLEGFFEQIDFGL